METQRILGAPASQALIDNLISSTSDPIFVSVKFDMKKISDTLSSIRDVLYDAEKKAQDQENGLAVKKWFDDLMEAAYDAEDVFHDFAYEVRKRKIENQVQNLCSPYFTAVAQKVRNVTRTLVEISKAMKEFKFVPKENNSTTSDELQRKHREAYPDLVDDSIIVGRVVEKEKILKLLAEDNHSIIAIVGVESIGKSMLAKMVYEDPALTDHFASKLWIPISECSDKFQLLNKVAESIDGKKRRVSPLGTVDVIRKSLKERFGMGKICIVLDDVNNGDIEWGFVLSNLSMNLQGSKIIATTRKEEVFGQMKQVSLQKLSKLSDEDCWSLFEKIAFGNGLGKTDELTRIGRQIVEKCQGEALAAKIIGSFLCSKQHEDDWLFVLNNKIWDAEKRDERLKGILKLRYDHLAPPLKKCISYCFIFHKCSVINKNKLIRSWMAENFLGSSMEVRALESIGKEYFNILMCNSFFKIVKRNVSGEIKSCRINDLIHDLEPSIVEAECSIVDVSEINEGKGMDRIRRMCLLFGTDHDISYIPTGTYKAMKLRTLNYSVSRVGKEIIKRVPEDLCFKLTFLRVLDLSHSAIRELPSSIGKLKLLSYLDISYTSVTTLPDSLTKLYNLRTLKLKSCCLREFPKEMRKLIGLRHLINSNNRSGQPKMPFELSKLSCLQKLSVFAVSKDSGFGIKELKVLSLLEGKLQIHNLENVSNESGAEDANLKNKTKISHVELYWSKDTGKHTDTASNVLEHLQPPQSLKNLVIHNFPGREFPTWLPANLPKLVSISLVNCYSCQLLPALGKLKSLKVLHLRKMNSVALIDDKFYRDSEEPFSALKELHLSEMSNLKWFNSSSSCFGCLEWLKIDKCTKLNVTPTLFPSLQKFEVSNSIGVAINSLVASNLKTLTSIEITRSVELTSLPHGLLQGNGVLQILEISDCKNFDGILPKQQAHQSQVRHNSSLKSLRIYHCPKLTSLPTVQGWISLHDLRIVDCRRLKFLPDGLQDLSKLEYLHIGGFSEDLECLPDQLQVLTSLQHLILEDFPSLVTLPNWLGNFCFLRKLVIRRCEKLKSLPSEEQMRRLTALQIVQLEQCPLLEDKGLGGESDKLAHIILQRDRPY